MNYIPGFSQHLQQFARGGRAQFDEEMIYDAEGFDQPMMFDADQQYVDPNATYFAPAEQPYVAPYVDPYQYQYAPDEQPYVSPYVAEQPYVAPYTAPIEQPYVAPEAERQFVSPRYNGEDIFNAAPVEQPYVAPYTAPTETPYVPGFTNYLETSVPPYVAPVETAAPYVAPVATSATAPADAPVDLSKLDFSGIDLSGLNNLYGMNFASDFGGGAMGGIYPDDPNTEYIGAPTSNRGNATGKTAGNTFIMTADQPVRLVDLNTNQIVFEGTGYDAARKASELGQNMTDTLGRKASYDIQTADPSGVYTTVANEKKNKSTLGEIANVAGTALPLAALAIPGLGPALFGMSSAAFASSIPAQLALGAALGGAGAGLKGQNILKGAALGGLGAAGGAVLGPAFEAGGALGTNLAPKLATAVGTGLSSTAGNLATGSSLKNSLIGGVLSGGLNYVGPDIVKGLGIGQGSSPSIGGGGDGAVSLSGPAPIVVSGYNTPSIGLSVGSASPRASSFDAEPKPLDMAGGQVVSGVNAPVGTGVLSSLANTSLGSTVDSNVINVLGSPRINGTGINIGNGTDTGALSTVNAGDLTKTTDTTLDQTTLDPNKTIEVLAGTTAPTTNFSIGSDGGALAKVADSTKTGEGSDNETINVSGSTLIPGTNIDIGNIGGGGLSTVNATDLSKTTDTKTDDGTITVIGGETVPGVSVPANTSSVSDVNLKPLTTDEEITVTGSKIIPGVNVPIGTNTSSISDVDLTPLTKDKEITVTGAETVPGTIVPTLDTKKKLGLEDYLSIAGKILPLLGAAAGSGSNQTGTYGSGRLNPIFSAKLPPAGGLNRTLRPMGDVDWLTYGQRPELSFYDYAPQIALPTPITTPIPNEPAGPSMYARDVDNMRFAQGGALPAKHGGPSHRTEFAVNGPGTGRSDDIPAVLSDGEYVIDAETVALLGDGSSKAGAKKLDDLRVKVRKHKGKKLAKGRFSANAKKPEAYLSGGRI